MALIELTHIAYLFVGIVIGIFIGIKLKSTQTEIQMMEISDSMMESNKSIKDQLNSFSSEFSGSLGDLEKQMKLVQNTANELSLIKSDTEELQRSMIAKIDQYLEEHNIKSKINKLKLAKQNFDIKKESIINTKNEAVARAKTAESELNRIEEHVKTHLDQQFKAFDNAKTREEKEKIEQAIKNTTTAKKYDRKPPNQP